MNNQMAITSTSNGAKFEIETVEILSSCGWHAKRNTKILGIGKDNRGIKPDILATKGNVDIVIENKSNGLKMGTLHEKWPYGMMKLSYIAKVLNRTPVMVIEDKSGKLGGFIENIMKPLSIQLNVKLVTKGELYGYAKG